MNTDWEKSIVHSVNEMKQLKTAPSLTMISRQEEEEQNGHMKRKHHEHV